MRMRNARRGGARRAAKRCHETRKCSDGAQRVQCTTQKVKEPIVDLTVKAASRRSSAGGETAARTQRHEREGARRRPFNMDVEARWQRGSGGVRVEPDDPCADSEICIDAAERESEEQGDEARLAEQLNR
eukprot:5623861-Pleurochrysis_carterae.AAC.1